ncbi:MAG: ribosome biogenesis GTP-binding protein YihA/YsxC [Rhodospirillales bacterium]|nr:ribosome biogenesis GTP-binding protein YihA/YsxC [Rhodospirillales bacterium]
MNNPTNEIDALEYGRWLFAQQCAFVMGAAELEQIPDHSLVEVAFAGRSNVGKSSLINALTGHKALARTSNTPGRTQQINFFLLGELLMLADLPGYGYARAPKSDVAKWTELVNAYLKGRTHLRRVCLLIDSRHGLKDSDRSVMDMLDEAAVSYQAVLTKCDKVKGVELAKITASVKDELAARPASHPDIIATSAAKGLGISELRALLAALAADQRVG